MSTVNITDQYIVNTMTKYDVFVNMNQQEITKIFTLNHPDAVRFFDTVRKICNLYHQGYVLNQQMHEQYLLWKDGKSNTAESIRIIKTLHSKIEELHNQDEHIGRLIVDATAILSGWMAHDAGFTWKHLTALKKLIVELSKGVRRFTKNVTSTLDYKHSDNIEEKLMETIESILYKRYNITISPELKERAKRDTLGYRLHLYEYNIDDIMLSMMMQENILTSN